MEKQMNLDQARAQIDAIDRQMADLYAKRMQAAASVAAWKMEHDLPVFDASREKDILERAAARMDNEELKVPYQQFVQFLMDQSKVYQRSLLSHDKVAYCGIEGAYAHFVSETLFPEEPKMPCSSFDEVFAAVARHEAEYGIVPLENTNSGLVGEVMDLLVEFPVYIQGAYDARIEQCLLGLPEATLKDIEWVYSKDQALAQSREFLESLQVETVAYPNTALAAKYVAGCQDKTKAALGARENAVLYGLKVLASNIEATSTNTTRFLILSARPYRDWGDRQSLIVSAGDEVGSLARIIDVITRHNLNMNCLQSRPMKNRPFEYLFYIQTEGNINEKQREEFLKELRPVCKSVKWLGSYYLRKDERI